MAGGGPRTAQPSAARSGGGNRGIRRRLEHASDRRDRDAHG
jgi:hypothetical protein